MARPREALRFLAVIAVGTCATLGLPGCDPYAVPREPDKAEVEINVHEDERLEMKLFLPSRFGHADLLRVGHDAGEALFGSGSGASGNAPVPEPATFVLLILATAGWYLRGGRAASKVLSTHRVC